MEFYVFCVTFRNALFRVGAFYAFYVVAPAAAFAATGAKVGIGIGAGHACVGKQGAGRSEGCQPLMFQGVHTMCGISSLILVLIRATSSLDQQYSEEGFCCMRCRLPTGVGIGGIQVSLPGADIKRSVTPSQKQMLEFTTRSRCR